MCLQERLKLQGRFASPPGCCCQLHNAVTPPSLCYDLPHDELPVKQLTKVCMQARQAASPHMSAGDSSKRMHILASIKELCGYFSPDILAFNLIDSRQGGRILHKVDCDCGSLTRLDD